MSFQNVYWHGKVQWVHDLIVRIKSRELRVSSGKHFGSHLADFRNAPTFFNNPTFHPFWLIFAPTALPDIAIIASHMPIASFNLVFIWEFCEKSEKICLWSAQACLSTWFHKRTCISQTISWWMKHTIVKCKIIQIEKTQSYRFVGISYVTATCMQWWGES